MSAASSYSKRTMPSPVLPDPVIPTITPWVVRSREGRRNRSSAEPPRCRSPGMDVSAGGMKNWSRKLVRRGPPRHHERSSSTPISVAFTEIQIAAPTSRLSSARAPGVTSAIRGRGPPVISRTLPPLSWI